MLFFEESGYKLFLIYKECQSLKKFFLHETHSDAVPEVKAFVDATIRMKEEHHWMPLK